MDRIIEAFKNTQLQPQVFSLMFLTLLLSVLSIVIYQKVKVQPVNKAPVGIVAVTEMYVMGMDTTFKEVTDGKIQKPAPYIFTLITFLLFGNMLSLLGLEPVTTSYSVPLTLGLITWIGIYVIGIGYNKWSYFKRYLNPMTPLNQIAPLISISFRIFGNIMGGSILVFLGYYVFGNIWSEIPVIGKVNFFGAMVMPWAHMYFDMFGGLIQAYLFTMLTMVYWSGQAE